MKNMSIYKIDFVNALRFSIDGLENIFFVSNEAYFHLYGAVNNHYCRVWSESEPDYVLEPPFYPEKN